MAASKIPLFVTVPIKSTPSGAVEEIAVPLISPEEEISAFQAPTLVLSS